MASTEKDVQRKAENERISKIPAENPKSPTGSHYDVLGVKPDATTEEITKAFKDLSLLVHPDKNQDDPDAEENFKKINAAHKLLTDEELRKLYDAAIKTSIPTPTESAPDSTPKEEPKEAPKNSLFRQTVKEGDDPMVQLMKEWLNMMLDMYGGNLEGAAWNQVKDAYKAVKNYLSEQDSPTEQQENTNIPKPKPISLTEEEIEARKLLGLNLNQAIDPQVVAVAANLKADELNNKISACNDKIEALGNEMSKAYEKLSEENNKEPPTMSRETYLEKHAAIYEQYQKDYNAIIRESDSYRSQHADCLMARDVLLKTPSHQANPSSDQPPLMTNANDTIRADDDEAWEMDDLFYPERREEAAKDLNANQELDNDVPQPQ